MLAEGYLIEKFLEELKNETLSKWRDNHIPNEISGKVVKNLKELIEIIPSEENWDEVYASEIPLKYGKPQGLVIYSRSQKLRKRSYVDKELREILTFPVATGCLKCGYAVVDTLPEIKKVESVIKPRLEYMCINSDCGEKIAEYELKIDNGLNSLQLSKI